MRIIVSAINGSSGALIRATSARPSSFPRAACPDFCIGICFIHFIYSPFAVSFMRSSRRAKTHEANILVSNSLPAHSDFSAIYNTDLALVHGVPIYDLPAVESLAVKASGIPPEKFFLARFPYPPWYALSTFYLGLLPAKAAATLWFELNLVMLFLSLWFL